MFIPLTAIDLVLHVVVLCKASVPSCFDMTPIYDFDNDTPFDLNDYLPAEATLSNNKLFSSSPLENDSHNRI